MKKLWNTLVVLGIVLCMIMSMGAVAEAAEGPKDLAVVAVAYETLTADQISRIEQDKAGMDVVVLDVNGLDGTDGAGYTYSYSDIDEGFSPSNYAFIWPGMGALPTRTVTDDMGTTCTVVFLPVGADDTAETINAAIAGYKQEGQNCVVIAVAPASSYNVQAAVESEADKVLTTDETDVSSDKLIKVGSDGSMPLSVITVGASGVQGVESMAMPDATMPGMVAGPGPEAQETWTITFEPGEGGQGTMDPATVNKNEAWRVAACLYSNDGADFTGWLLSSDNEVHQPDEAVVISGDITATAQWSKQAAQYFVSFEGGQAGDAEVEGSMTPAVLDENAVYQLPVCNYTASGYEFAGWSVNGEIKQPLVDSITLNAETAPAPDNSITVTATWKTVAETAPSAAQTYTINFANGNESASGEMAQVTNQPAGEYTLPACQFQVEGKQFSGWTISGLTELEGQTKMNGENITLSGENNNITLTATWQDTAPQTFEVIYKAGDYEGAPAEVKDTGTVNTVITMDPNRFTRDGYNLTGWKVNDTDTIIAADGTYQFDKIPDVAVFTAQWTEASKTTKAPGATTSGDVTYIQGGTDKVTLYYNDATVASVAVDGAALSLNSQYGLNADSKGFFFDNNYLNGLVVGNHTLTVTFLDTTDATFSPDNRQLVIKAQEKAEEPEQPANTVTSIQRDWDRSQNLVIDFASYGRGNPIKLEIDYGKQGYKEAVKDRDYAISGTTMTLFPDMVNKNWGEWSNQQYRFRVTFDGPMTVSADSTGNSMELYLKVMGDAPTTIANPSPSPTLRPDGTSPVTGDTNNVTLYIVILVVLIIALAAVLIVVMRRKNR